MNRKRTRLVLMLVFAGVLVLQFTDSPAAAEFRAAIAVRDVTPDPLLPVSGGVGPSKPVNKKIGVLTVRALVLEAGDTRVAICSADFLGFPGVLSDKVRKQVPDIPPENILIAATHNHSAPDCYGFPGPDGRTAADLKYLDGVCTKLADAINHAARQLQPAQLKIATGKARGKIAYNYYAENLYDPRCGVIQLLDPNEKPFATLINYACHPEVIGAGQGILSPDFVGPLYDRIEQKGAGTGIFINGALGGMVTADCRGPDGKDIRSWDECIRIGSLLADEALRIVADATIQKNPTLACASTPIKFPVENPLLRAVLQLSPLGFAADETGCISTRLNLVNLADAQILTIPGEALPNIGYYLKRKMHGRHNLLFGLTNDAFGYILTKVDYNSFDRYDYITRTSLGEMTGEILIEQALKSLDSFPHPPVIPSPP